MAPNDHSADGCDAWSCPLHGEANRDAAETRWFAERAPSNPTPAAEPRAEGGAPGIGEAAVLAAALIKTGHTEQEAIERAIHLLHLAPVADPTPADDK